jgi:uncharacterized protein YrrD
MLQLSQSLLGRPVMSLRTGTQVALVTSAIINPNNLKIEGFHVQDSLDKKAQLVLLYQDIRDIIPQGIVINDHDVLADPTELIRLKDVLELKFELLGKPVYTESKEKIGKVNDFATETSSMVIKKLYVAQPLLKNFSGGSLSVDRTRIVEITNRRIVIQDLLGTERSNAVAVAPAI